MLRLKTTLLVVITCLSLVVVTTAACGSGEAEAAATSASEDAPDTSSGVKAAEAAGSVETRFFSTVLPQGWEVLADDIDSMGLMTLAEKGTGGSQGVYLKFEGGGNFTGDPAQLVEKFAGSYDGSAPSTSQRNGIDWVSTRFTYNGIEQSLNMTAHNGYKITFTVMGRDYDADPGVKAVFDALEWK